MDVTDSVPLIAKVYCVANASKALVCHWSVLTSQNVPAIGQD